MYKINELETNSFLNDDNKYGVIPDSTLEIHIESGEGYIPHMHICKKTGKTVVLRLEIMKNKYFREKDDKGNKLNARERKALQKYLLSTSPRNPSYTKWDYIVDTWDMYNPEHKIPLSATQPDYTDINE